MASYGQMAGLGASVLGGAGQGMMTGRFKQAYNAGAGALGDIYAANKYADMISSNDPQTAEMTRRWQDLSSKMMPARRGVALTMPNSPAQPTSPQPQ